MSTKLRLVTAAVAVTVNLAGAGLSNQGVVQAADAVTQTKRPCGSRKPAGTAAMPRRNQYCRKSAPRRPSAVDTQAEPHAGRNKGA